MIFDRTKQETRADTSVNDWKTLYSFENGYDITPFEVEMKESTYFSSIKIIGESIGKCNLEVKQETEKGEFLAKNHYLYDLLRLRPNPYMSAMDCYKTAIALMKHYGHSGLLINRKGSKIEGLYPVKLTQCTIDNSGLIKGTKNNKILWDYESIDSETGSAFDKDIIVLKDFTLDGIKGKATRSIVSQTLDTSIKSQNYLNTLFGNSMTSKIAVQLTSDIRDENELKKLQEKFNRIYSSNGRIFTIPAGFSVSTLDLKLSDAEFTELRKLSKEEIATTMQVPLSKLGIQRDTAISEEQDNIKFLSDCLQPIMTQFEQEIDYKLLTNVERQKGYKIRFNIAVMLRTDSKTQAEVITNYVRNGVYTINDSRRILGLSRLDIGDHVFMPSGQVSLDALVNGDASWQNKSNETGGDE